MTRTWNDHVGFTFCEGTQGSFLGVDEIVNCLSSCVLLGVGIRGGLRQGIDNFTCLLYGALTVCGLGSVMFHAHLIEAFRFVDELAILYLVSLGYYVAALNYLHQKGIRTPFFRYSFAVVTVSSFIGIAEVDIFNGNLYLFCLLTAVLVSGIFFFAVNGGEYLSEFERELVKKGQIACAVASIAWIVDMAFCWPIVSYFYLHALWHCLMAITVNYFIEIHESQIKRMERKGLMYTTFYGPFVFIAPSIPV